MQGEPRTMQDEPRYEGRRRRGRGFLEERLAFAVAAGIPEERICLDPGFGFGKTVEQNFELLGRLGEIVALGRPVLVGLSRKRSLGRILGDPTRRGPAVREPRSRRRGLRARRRDLPRARRPRARRGADRGRGGLSMILELKASRSSAGTGAGGGAARRPGVSLRHSRSTSATRAPPIGSRTPSTTERSPTACARSRTAGTSTSSRRSRRRSPMRSSSDSRSARCASG